MNRQQIESLFEQLLRKKIQSGLTPAEVVKFAHLKDLRRMMNPRSREEIRNDADLHYKTRQAIKRIRAIAYQK